jgi:predicted LPLAT superfamily acyltransferase
MTSHTKAAREWMSRPERGSTLIIRLMVWIALRLGRPVARILLYPICAYFIAVSHPARVASRAYLARALNRPPSFLDVFRNYHAFAATLLDRVFLLGDRHSEFDIRVHGDEVLLAFLARGEGCFLLGAHLGSFEAVRAVGRRLPGLRVSMAMYEENARKINAVLGLINPELNSGIISLGRSHAMLKVADRLAKGEFVGMLGDRLLKDEEEVRLPFLGKPAAFPLGPYRIAAMLRRPLILMVGIYRGGRHYDIYFEPLADFSMMQPNERNEATIQAAGRFAERIEYWCRSAPYNWFNFYDFWQ